MNGSNGLNDIINKLTENPEMMKSLMAAAGNIMNNGGDSNKDFDNNSRMQRPPVPPPDEYDRFDGEKHGGIDRKKRRDDAENLICLLNALKPYVSGERCKKIDSIVKILKLIQLSEKTGLLKSLL